MLPAGRCNITSLGQNRATPTILWVEDDEDLRLVTAEILVAFGGYRVLSAGSGAEALNLARSHPGEIDILLTDGLIPDLSGPELAAALQAEHPRLKVMFVTGGLSNPPPGLPILLKPFTVKMLLAMLGKILEI